MKDKWCSRLINLSNEYMKCDPNDPRSNKIFELYMEEYHLVMKYLKNQKRTELIDKMLK